MSKAQILSYTAAQTASRLRVYKALFAISIVANLEVGFWCIFDPVGFAHAVSQPANARLRVVGKAVEDVTR